MIKSITHAAICLTTLLFLMSCEGTNTGESATSNVKALAIVNGQVITEQEVLQQSPGPSDHDANPEMKLRREKALLDTLIENELAAQKALELGLDTDPAYTAQLQRIATQLGSFNRDQLSKLFQSSEINAKAIIADAEIDKYIADNEAIIHFESHILQILQRDPVKIQQLHDQLAAGQSFDAAAAEVYPKMPDPTIRPWDQGYMNWERIPGAWTDTLRDMQPGETSGVIKGTRNRFWIIRLVDRRADDTADMTARRVRVRQILQHEKIQELKESTIQALTDAAEIVYTEELTTINGSPISRQDVVSRINKNRRDESNLEPGEAKIRKVLDDMIKRELMAQEARELGLDADAEFQEQLGRLQARIANLKRTKLSELFFRQEVTLKAQVTDAEALAYATEHAAKLQTEIKVWQILHRDLKQAEQVKAELDQGEPFESVAARRFPDLPESMPNPWELGYLNWEQIPDAWWDTLNDLAMGETSGIIRAPNRRFWIIKLIDRRQDAKYSLESSKAKIKAILQKDKAKQLRVGTIKALRDKADIIFPAT